MVQVRVIVSSVRCDWCEKVSEVEDDEEFYGDGWITASRGEDEEAQLDFCSRECASSYFA